MSTLEQMEIKLEGIGHALSDSMLAVPTYQRSYAWEEQHVNDLFEDTFVAIHKGEPEYFLGSIVVTSHTAERPEVVDGQQRLATTSILIAAIRDWFLDQDDEEAALEIQRDYLATMDLRTRESDARLRLNEGDHDFYEKRIISLPTDPEREIKPSKQSHRRIDKAAQLAKEYVQRIISSSSSPEEDLLDWVDYFKDNVKVIMVSVPTYANAFTIFETLNDRGLDLAISDLLKNHLFHLSDTRISEVQGKWIAMNGALETVGGENIVVDYIRHLWSSKYGLTREKDLYDNIKQEVSTRRAAITFSGDLVQNANIYAAIINAQHELWNDYGPTSKEHMTTINTLRMIQIRPLILAMLDNFNITQVKKALPLMVAWGVRLRISGSLGGGVLERHYSDRAKEVRSGKIKTAVNLRDAMKEVVPGDKQFETDFGNATVSFNYLGRYYLRALENQARGEVQPELIPNPNAEVVNLEHILPQNPGTAWSHIDEETAAAYHTRIGNMALLKSKINLKIGNDGFLDKRPFYKDSDFLLTSGLKKFDEWGSKQIEKRQSELAKLAVKTWPLTIRRS